MSNYVINCIKLNAISIAHDYNNDYQIKVIEKFNKYSNENDLGINIELNVFTEKNFTGSIFNYGDVIESILKKSKTKYDLYFYDNTYGSRYGNYFLDLKEYLSEDLIKLYDKKIISDTCIYKNKLIALPSRLEYNILYSNRSLLKKYNKTIPETWDELIETSKYILEEEKKSNKDIDLIGYNGYFNDKDDEMLSSTYEFIYSYRDTYESSFPDITSQTAINAINKIKQIKEDISSESIFRSNEEFAISRLLLGKAIFIKFIILPDQIYEMLDYNMTVLPGVKKGISGSIIIGNNISITKYPNDKAYDKRKEAALFAFKYLASREIQKEFLTKRIVIPGIMDLYYDEDVCKIAHCQLFRSIQPIGKPIFERDDYNYYAEKFKIYFSEFLYGNVSAKDALKNIKDISYIYEISTSTKYTSAGLINFLILSVIITLMFLSLIFIFLNNFNPFFEFLSQEYWILIVFGSIMNLSACFTKFGTLTSFKCQLSILLLSLGFSFSFIPILNK
ncbi:periplasmic binding protein-like II, partial [Neocallimastix californiae]